LERYLDQLLAWPFQDAVDGHYGPALAIKAVEILDDLGRLPLGEVLHLMRLADDPRGLRTSILKACEEALADHAAWQAQNDRG
jgi:hypothetical protein